MNSTKVALLFLLFFASLSSYAQEKKDSLIADEKLIRAKSLVHKFGEVSLSEFDTKVSGVDSAASAVVLFDVGNGFFVRSQHGTEYVFECHTRFKVINKSGYEYANLALQLFKFSGYGISLQSIDGATYNLENGKIVSSKIGNDAKFSEKLDKNFTLKKYTLPNVKEGSIIEFRYKLRSDYLFRLFPWYFQRAIPTLFSEYSVNIRYGRYMPSVGGYVNVNPHKEDFKGGTFYHFYAENVPGLKEENFVTTMDDYRSNVVFEFNSNFATNWPTLIHTLKTEERFGRLVNDTSFSKNLLKEVIKEATDPDTVVNVIFNYVKNNIKWNSEMNMYASESSVKSILDKKTGNSADINLCMLSLLTAAKFSAFPVVLSTRKNGLYPGFPTLSGFNNVIVAVAKGEALTLLDATDKNLCPGLINYQNLNHQGFMINMETGKGGWISLEDEQISKKNFTCSFILDDQNKLSGRMYITSNGYEALRRREEYKSASNQGDFLKGYRIDKPGLTIKNYEIKNLDNPSENLTESMDLTIEDNVEQAGNLTYFTPMLFEQVKENPFKLDERKFPVDFGFPSEQNYRITIEFPKGYDLEKIPKNEKIVLPDNRAVFSFIAEKEENKLMLSSKIALKSAVFAPEEYKDLKELFMNVVRKQAEQVVFKKN